MTWRAIFSSKWLRVGAAILITATASLITNPTATALAQGATSAANIPFSGISPGGVDMATGELILVMHPDLRIDGPMPLVYRRYYASLLASDGLASGHMGTNWLGTFDWTLSVVGPNATLVTNRGAAIRFMQSPVGSWDLVSPTYAKFKLDVLAGGVWRFTNPLDRRLYFFDAVRLLLTQVQDERGNALNLTYTGGLLTQVSDGLGRTLGFSYDASNHLTQVGDGTRTVHYTYTGALLTGVQDAAGRNWSYNYLPTGPNLIGVMEPLSNTPVTQAYDATGRVISQTDALGNMAMYSYGTPSGNVYRDPLGNPWTYQHDAQNRLTTRIDPIGGPRSYAYDASGRLMTLTRPMGDPTSFSYDPASGYPSMLTLADSSSVSWGYGSHSVGGATLFDLASASYPDLTSESYGRDLSGNLTDFRDPGAFHWMGTYNSRGQVLTWTNPSAGVTTFTYDPQGRPATRKDNAGNTTNYAYDGLSRLIQVTWPNATSRMYAYDNLDALTGLTDERGKLWSYSYDANERLVTETDPLLQATGFLYDALDRVTQVVDPLSHATLYAYDPNGRLSSVTDRSGRMTSYRYDALNRLTGVMDPAGGTDAFGWDQDSRMISGQDPLGHSSSFVYDNRDRLTHMTDPVGTGFDYGYDVMGRLRTATAPLGHTQTFNYDPRGLLASFFNSTSETDFLRTPLGEVSQVTDPNRNGWPRAYDPQGRIISSADPLARTTSYLYDSRSRVTHAELPLGSVNFTYDPASRVSMCQWLDGTTLTYSYDDANRLVGATGVSFAYDAAGRMINSNGLTFTYDNEGRVLSETLAPGKVVSYAYDSRGLPSQVMDWMGGTTSFTYDAARRLTGITRPNGTSATYAYDAANRLINEVESQPGPIQLSSIGITRDVLGQPTSIARRQPLMPGATMGSSSAFTYDVASQMNGVTHDPLGRTTGDASRSFQWDGASRLTHYTAGADSPRFTYDAFGQPLTSTQPNPAVAQAWNYGRGYPTNDDMQVLLPSSRTRYLVRAPSGLLLYGVDGPTGARSYYHYDEKGNTAFLTNDGGSVTTEYAYTPFGGVAALGQTSNNPFTYGGAQGAAQLGSSGAFRMGGGIYDAVTMRGISGNTTHSGHVGIGPGPIQSPGSWVTLDPGPIGSPGAWVTGQPGPQQSPGALILQPGMDLVGPNQSPGAWVELNLLTRETAGTLLHELGHTFGLNHGGADPGPIGSPGAWVATNPGPVQNFPSPVPMSGASGIGEIYGNDAIVSLGKESLVRRETGTLMHELGHTFGLNHGGPGPDTDGDGLQDAWETGQRTDYSHNPVGVDVNCEGLIEGGGEEIFPDKYSRVKVRFHWEGESSQRPKHSHLFVGHGSRLSIVDLNDEGPEETIKIVYGKVGINYVPQDDGPSRPGRPEGGWLEWRFGAGSPCTWCAR